MQKVESKIANTEVLSDLDLEIVASGKGTVGIAQATVTPWITLASKQLGYSIGERAGRALGSAS